MRRLLLAVPFALIATSSFAAWESGMVEDEGGEVMMAWVYGANTGANPPELRMFCGDQVSLRFGQGGTGEGEEPITDPIAFSFDFGEETETIEMRYEEMDGMYAGYIEPDAPAIALLRSADSVAVDAPSGPWPVQEFTLTGSSKAISAVLKTCD